MNELTMKQVQDVNGGLLFLAAAPAFIKGVGAGLGLVAAGAGIYAALK